MTIFAASPGGSVKKVKSEMMPTSTDAETFAPASNALDHDFGTVFETAVVNKPYLTIDLSEKLSVEGVDVYYEMAGRAEYTNGNMRVYLTETFVDFGALTDRNPGAHCQVNCQIFGVIDSVADATTR